MKIAVAALVSLIVGLGLGALLFGNDGGATPAPVVEKPCVEAQTAAIAPTPPPPVRIVSFDAGSTASERCGNAEQAVAQLQSELVALNDRFAAVQAKLDATEKERMDREGTPIPKPQNLAPRFEQEAMRTSVEKALKEAGFTKAEVTSVDCTEYPCVVYGTGMGSKEDFHKLDQAPSLDAYNDDGRSGWGWGTRGADGGNIQSFGVAFLPKDRTSTDDLYKRMQYRVQEYQHASGGR